METCSWSQKNETMQKYHDNEWCVPSYDDTYIFEMLTLEGAQAGLSWNTILLKREAYKMAFHDFDIEYCSKLTDDELENIKEQYDIIKNKLKIRSVRSNAIAIKKIQAEFGSFSNYLWQYVNFDPIINHWTSDSQVPAKTDISEKISKGLKKRGFKFVGPVIIYSFMQAIGMVDDHITECPYHSLNR